MIENYWLLIFGVIIFIGVYKIKDDWWKRIMLLGSGMLICEGLIFLILNK